MLRVSVATIRREIANRRLSRIKVGNRVFVTDQAINAYINRLEDPR